MQTEAHKAHIAANVAHNDCNECRADGERRQTRTREFRYQHVGQYPAYVRPRLAALATDDSVPARCWHKDFVTALNRRISSHAARDGRKQADGYRERLLQYVDRQFGGYRADAAYLREFARRGASTLQ